MAMNRTTFFAFVRKAPCGGNLWQSQVDGLTKILDEWDRRALNDIRFLAYMLATVFHETGGKIQPIREGGGEKYLKSKPYYPWVGEGLVQVTWEKNARKFGATAPGQLMTWPIALRALFDGMLRGMFTGKKLSDYFGVTIDDPVGARKIINGTDKAQLIAGYYKNFLDAINASQDTAKIAEVDIEDAKPDDKPATQSAMALLSTAAPAAAGIALPALTGINNLYSLVFMLVLLIAACGIGYMFLSGRFSVTKGKAL
jgi:hypothetical protein